MKIYSSSDGSATINNTSIRGCFTFQNFWGAGPDISAAGGPTGFIVTNATIADCYMFAEQPMINYNTPSNRNWVVANNTIVASGFTVKDVISGAITNNTMFGDKTDPLSNGGDYPTFQLIQEQGTNSLDWAHFVWDYNRYYIRSWHVANDTEFITYFSGISYGWYFSQWQTNMGFDLHSTYTRGDPRWNDGHADAWPTNYLDAAVRRLDYDTNRYHVCVVSTSGQTNLAFNLSSCGFNPGDRYRLRDAQNPLVTVRYALYQGGTIDVPLNLTNVVGLFGNRNTNVHANVLFPGLFNVFILDRVPKVVPASNLHVIGSQP